MDSANRRPIFRVIRKCLKIMNVNHKPYRLDYVSTSLWRVDIAKLRNFLVNLRLELH